MGPGIAGQFLGGEHRRRVVAVACKIASEGQDGVVGRIQHALVAGHLPLVAANALARHLIGPGAFHARGLGGAVEVDHQFSVGGVPRRVFVPRGPPAVGGGHEVDLHADDARGRAAVQVGGAGGGILHLLGVDPHPDAHALGLGLVAHGLQALPLVPGAVFPLLPAVIHQVVLEPQGLGPGDPLGLFGEFGIARGHPLPGRPTRADPRGIHQISPGRRIEVLDQGAVHQGGQVRGHHGDAPGLGHGVIRGPALRVRHQAARQDVVPRGGYPQIGVITQHRLGDGDPAIADPGRQGQVEGLAVGQALQRVLEQHVFIAPVVAVGRPHRDVAREVPGGGVGLDLALGSGGQAAAHGDAVIRHAHLQGPGLAARGHGDAGLAGLVVGLGLAAEDAVALLQVRHLGRAQDGPRGQVHAIRAQAQARWSQDLIGSRQHAVAQGAALGGYFGPQGAVGTGDNQGFGGGQAGEDGQEGSTAGHGGLQPPASVRHGGTAMG